MRKAWPPAGLVALASKRLREEGAEGLGWRTLRWLGLYRRFWVIGGSDQREPREPRIPVDCAKLEPEQVDEYLQLRPDQSGEMIRRRLADGEWCFVARSEGRLVAATWVARRRAWLEFLDGEILLDEGVCHPHDTFAHPEVRGLGVADAVSAFRVRFTGAAGVGRAVGLIEPENRRAAHRSEKKGYTVIGRLGCFRLGTWRHLRLRLDEPVGEAPVRLPTRPPARSILKSPAR